MNNPRPTGRRRKCNPEHHLVDPDYLESMLNKRSFQINKVYSLKVKLCSIVILYLGSSFKSFLHFPCCIHHVYRRGRLTAVQPAAARSLTRLGASGVFRLPRLRSAAGALLSLTSRFIFSVSSRIVGLSPVASRYCWWAEF